MSLPPLAHWRNERLLPRDSGESLLVMHVAQPAAAAASSAAAAVAAPFTAAADHTRELVSLAAAQLEMRRSASMCRFAR